MTFHELAVKMQGSKDYKVLIGFLREFTLDPKTSPEDIAKAREVLKKFKAR